MAAPASARRSPSTEVVPDTVTVVPALWARRTPVFVTEKYPENVEFPPVKARSPSRMMKPLEQVTLRTVAASPTS